MKITLSNASIIATIIIEQCDLAVFDNFNYTPFCDSFLYTYVYWRAQHEN